MRASGQGAGRDNQLVRFTIKSGESVGGKLLGFWYAFGQHNGYNLWEAPDNMSMAAVALAIGGGGALSAFETTVLLSVEETMDALRKAEKLQYQAPGISVSW